MDYPLDDKNWSGVLKLEDVLALPPYKRRRIVAVSEDHEEIFGRYDALVRVAMRRLESCGGGGSPAEETADKTARG